MCPPFTPFFFPPLWLACWAAGAATAWASRAAQMSASSTPNSSETKLSLMPAPGLTQWTTPKPGLKPMPADWPRHVGNVRPLCPTPRS